MKLKPPKSGLAIGASKEAFEDGDSAELSNGDETGEQGGEDTQSEENGVGDDSEGVEDGVRGGADPSGGTMTPRRILHSGLPLTDVRAVPITPKKRKVAFTPVTTGELVVELQDSGTDTNYPLHVVHTSAGVIDGGRISKLAVQAGIRLSPDVELADAFAGTMRVVANAV